MNLTNPFERYYAIQSLMLNFSFEFPCTIAEIAKHLSVPIHIIRSDIAALVLNPLTRNKIYVNDPDKNTCDPETFFYSDNTCFFYESIANNDLKLEADKLDKAAQQKVKTLFMNGHYDHQVFHMPSQLYIGLEGEDTDAVLIPLSSDERLALDTYDSEFVSSSKKTPRKTILVKYTTIKLSEDQQKAIREIKKAISSKKSVLFNSKRNNGKQRAEIVPHHIFHQSEDNFAYCIDISGQAHRLDRLTEDHTVFTATRTVQNLPSENDRAKYMWGASADSHSPVEVKLQLINNTANLLKKFKADTALREAGKLDEDTLIYSDTVLDLNAFRRWLRGYGSSVIVLEPESLAKEMYLSAKKMKECYERGEFL